jgi:hypothetical protein
MFIVIVYLGFSAKSVVELIEDSVDIGEELRWACYGVLGLELDPKKIYHIVPGSVPDPDP